MTIRNSFMRACLAASVIGSGIFLSSCARQDPVAISPEQEPTATPLEKKPFAGPHNFVIYARTSDGYMTRVVTLLTPRMESIERSGNYPDPDIIGTFLQQEWTRFIGSKTHDQYNDIEQKFFELCVIYAVDNALNRYFAMTGVDMKIYEIVAERPITQIDFTQAPPIIRLLPFLNMQPRD